MPAAAQNSGFQPPQDTEDASDCCLLYDAVTALQSCSPELPRPIEICLP